MSLLVASFGKKDPLNPLLHDPVYAIALAFLSGIVQFILGVLHLGEYGKMVLLWYLYRARYFFLFRDQYEHSELFVEVLL